MRTAPLPAVDPALAGYESCLRLLQSPDLEPVDVAGHLARLAAATGLDLGCVLAFTHRVLFFVRGDAHVALRRAVLRYFRPSRIAVWDAALDAESRAAAARVAGEVDLVRDFALPLTARVMCRVLGVPLAAIDDVERWADEIRWLTEPMLPLRRLRAMNDALRAFHALLDAADWAAPADGPPSFLAAMRSLGDAPRRVGREELIWLTIAVHGAGRQSWHTLSNVLLAFLSLPPEERPHPDDAGAWQPAVDHLLRLHGSVQAVVRVARRDVDVGGRTIAAGEHVYVPLAAANRDPSRFGCPVTALDGPHGAAHLSFGAGLHRCVGTGLARSFLGRALAAFARRHPRARLTDTMPQWSTTRMIHSPVTLPVHLDPPSPPRRGEAR